MEAWPPFSCLEGTESDLHDLLWLPKGSVQPLLNKGGAAKKLDFPGGTVVKNPLANAGGTTDMGLIPRLGKSPEGGNGNPLQDSWLEKSYGQTSLVGYSPWGCKELDTTWVSEYAHTAKKLPEARNQRSSSRLPENRLEECRPCTHPDLSSNPTLELLP